MNWTGLLDASWLLRVEDGCGERGREIKEKGGRTGKRGELEREIGGEREIVVEGESRKEGRSRKRGGGEVGKGRGEREGKREGEEERGRGTGCWKYFH